MHIFFNDLYAEYIFSRSAVLKYFEESPHITKHPFIKLLRHNLIKSILLMLS